MSTDLNLNSLQQAPERRSKETSWEALRLEVTLLEERCQSEHEKTMVRLTARVVSKFLAQVYADRRVA